MKLLLHVCCAPCSVYCIDTLRAEGVEPTLYWYNPNIHPYHEYVARRDSLIDYAKRIKVQLIIEEEYGLVEHCQKSLENLDERCVNFCYPNRLSHVVRYAANHGFDTFSTTLLYSPYQKHDEIKKICEELSKLSDVAFLYRDFRLGYRTGQEKSRVAGLYMQKYCGCIFSEADRYAKRIARDAAAHPEPYFNDYVL